MQSEQNVWEDENLIKTLKNGGVAVMPTDTLYGIVGQALTTDTVERIYKLKKRAPDKPCIVLIGDISELEKFAINFSEGHKKVINNFPTPTSFILDCPNDKFSYLHRGTKTLAFRIPTQMELQNLLKETGPLIAPSANPEGLSPALNIEEAKTYFSDSVNMYVDGGEITGKASKVIKLHKDGSITILRE
ncbi:MAG: L-threonylcarbamoyladenylate synthase [bacterium]